MSGTASMGPPQIRLQHSIALNLVLIYSNTRPGQPFLPTISSALRNVSSLTLTQYFLYRKGLYHAVNESVGLAFPRMGSVLISVRCMRQFKSNNSASSMVFLI